MLMVAGCGFLGTSARADDECVQRIKADSRLEPIRDKLPIFITSPSMTQLADHTRPTKAQKRALLAYDEDRSFCETETGHAFGGDMASVYQGFVVNSRKLRAQLYDGKIDFAAFVSTDADNAQTFVSYVQAQIALAQQQAEAQARANTAAAEQAREQQAQNARLAQERQAEYQALQRQQDAQNNANLMALGAQLLQSSRPVPMAPPPRMPVITNCQNNGYGATNCTSY